MVNTCKIEDLKKQPEAVIRQACISKEPIYIEQNGTASVLLIEADTYLTQMQALSEFERIYIKGVTGKPLENSTLSEAAVASVDSVGGDTEATKTSSVRWRCKICGFEIEMDELPDDFTCPVCGVGKDMFERV